MAVLICKVLVNDCKHLRMSAFKYSLKPLIVLYVQPFVCVFPLFFHLPCECCVLIVMPGYGFMKQFGLLKNQGAGCTI